MEAYCYRICTQNVNREEIEHIVSQHVQCFATYEARGFWRGTYEHGLTIEYVQTGNKFDLDATSSFIAEGIRAANHQEAVLVYSFPVDYFMTKAITE